MEKLFYFDLETTGVKPEENGVHQISGAITYEGVIAEYFNFKVRPFPQDVIDPKALAVSRLTPEQVMEYPEPETVFKDLIALLDRHVSKYDKADKMYLVGYNNAHFDNPFLRAFFLKNGHKYFGSYFWSNSLDVMVLASYALMQQRPQMPNFKLMTVAREFGIEVDEAKAHNAVYDTELLMEVFWRVTVKQK